MDVSAASLAPDWPVCKATPSDNTERTARSGAVVETIFLSRPRRAQCTIPNAPHVNVQGVPHMNQKNSYGTIDRGL